MIRPNQSSHLFSARYTRVAFKLTMASYNSLPEHIKSIIPAMHKDSLSLLCCGISELVQRCPCHYCNTSSVSTVTQWESPGLPASANFQHFPSSSLKVILSMSFAQKVVTIIGPFGWVTRSVQDKNLICGHKDEQRARAIHSGRVNFVQALNHPEMQ